MAQVMIQGNRESSYMQLCHEGSHYVVIFHHYEDLLAGLTNSEDAIITAGCNNSCSDWEVLEATAVEPRLPMLFLAEIGLLSRVPNNTYAFYGSSGLMFYGPGTIIPACDEGGVTFLRPGEEILLDPHSGPTYYKNEGGHLVAESKAAREAKQRQLREDTQQLLEMGLTMKLVQPVREAAWNEQIWCVDAVLWTNKIFATISKSVWLKALPLLRKFSQAHRPVDSDNWYEGDLMRLVKQLRLPELPSNNLLIVNAALVILEERTKKS